jgi:hypothetical protein
MSRDYKIGDENNKKPQAESLRQLVYYVLMGTFFRLDGDVSRWKSVVVVGQVSRD